MTRAIRHAIQRLRRQGRRRLGRGAFSLLEVMIATAILVTTVAIIVRIQATSVSGAIRAQKIVVATDLAQEKLGEAMMSIELEGIGSQDIYEHGDFDDFGDDQRLDFGDELDEFHWQYWVEEVEFNLSPDVMGFMGGGDDEAGGAPAIGGPAGAAGGAQGDMMDQLGLGGDQMSEQLAQFIRRVRVRVWWGEDSKEAEEKGTEVVITTHIISPDGAFRQLGGDPNNPGGNGAAGAGGGFGGGGGGANSGRGRGGGIGAPGVPRGLPSGGAGRLGIGGGSNR